MLDVQKVSVIGLGYIGLPTAAVIASRGIKVLGIDTNPDIVKTVGSGSIHIAEPDLDGLVQKVVSNGSLVVGTEPEPADVFIIAVPTPIDHANRPDLTCVMAAVERITGVLAPGNLVILESTSPIGTTERISKKIVETRPDLTVGTANGSSIFVAYCPERVLPGRILTELVNNDRCIGGVTALCARKAQRFYKMFVRGACVATTARTAELVKLTENAYRDTNIAFANELSLICDRYEINVWEAIDLANRHPRVNVLRPGPGVGGHCIAVDPWFIIDAVPDLARVMRTSREVNNHKTETVIERAAALIDDHPYANVACCGLAFKANVDDLRESPALEIAIHLAEKYGSRIKVVEPNIRSLPPVLANHGAERMGIDEALRTCEIAILLVDHDEFKMVPLAERRHLDVIDTRGIWQDMSVRF
ncbi:UDP-N-acetyl-D-mannosaminuronic acid dehydrogenase [Afipia sp. Root123D2]|jgi:UDP-N-acetyl-D-mannosaminuronic acid dehydrogenase|uniref:UDP-N-acetyl-D-mannosamine dehydrogenase n=1 Tax=Afipia sp. Root123D2 TaxID=1736436 RepID=UPI0006F450DB|nr:UDP-N-acetyl-D-mannosamine dehydrogenase [Afipia sp. Root123D2]KQW22247.1 UDP-N-acetyl-D-mannosaminuronic acid dehydrogenase [Afipia sp. Root123D2]